MSDETFVSAADVARLAGVGRAAVSNWRRRYPDFPEPASESGEFRRGEVEQWLRSQGKLLHEPDGDAAWRVLDLLRAELKPVEAVAEVAEYLAGSTRVNNLSESVRGLLDGLSGDPGEVVEQLCTQLFDRQQRQPLMTSPELAALMVELADPDSTAETVLDPACGAANILKAAAEHGARHLFGQETDHAVARLARARLVLAGEPESVQVAAADTMRADAWPDLRADAVICDPPFGLRDWGHDELSVDPRWEYGLPPKGEPELAWIQHCLARAERNGSVVVAVPAAVASRRSGRAIRRTLVQRGALRAVLALPAGVLRSTGIPIHLWVLHGTGEPGGAVLLVDASEHQPKRRGRVNWQAVREAILEPWGDLASAGEVTTVAGKQRTIEAIELLDEEVDLTPARHLPPATAHLDVGTLESTRETLAGLLSELGALLPPLRQTQPQPTHRATLHELARAGTLTLHQQVRGLEFGEDEAAGPLVLTGRDVATGQPPSTRLPEPPGPDALWLRPGDVVVPALAAGDGRSRPQVVTAHDGDVVLGPNLHLIRVNPDKLDPEFVAGHLRSGQAKAGASTVSGVHRLDVRRVEIPMLELGQQREQGEAFRRITAFTQGARRLADSGEALATQLTDALAVGVAAADVPDGEDNR